jgi:hypothetical protein
MNAYGLLAARIPTALFFIFYFFLVEDLKTNNIPCLSPQGVTLKHITPSLAPPPLYTISGERTQKHGNGKWKYRSIHRKDDMLFVGVTSRVLAAILCVLSTIRLN